MEVQSNNTRNLLISLLIFLGVGAIGGGTVLIISPSGEMMGVSTFDFKNMPFESFLIPGIILLIFIGVCPLLVALALVRKKPFKLGDSVNIFRDMHWSWSFCIYQAFLLIGWIQIQLIFLQGPIHWLHVFILSSH